MQKESSALHPQLLVNYIMTIDFVVTPGLRKEQIEAHALIRCEIAPGQWPSAVNAHERAAVTSGQPNFTQWAIASMRGRGDLFRCSHYHDRMRKLHSEVLWHLFYQVPAQVIA